MSTNNKKVYIDADTSGETAAWRVNGTTATYGTSARTLIKVTGLNSGATAEDFSLNGKIVTVAANALGTGTAKITVGNYKLAMAQDVARRTTTAANWQFDDTTATYNSASTTAGYVLAADKKSITYKAAVASRVLATVSGLKSGVSSSDIVLNGTNIILRPSALDTTTVTVTGNYNLALAGGVTKSTVTPARFVMSDGGMTATYKSRKISQGYVLAGNKKSVKYTATSGGTNTRACW